MAKQLPVSPLLDEKYKSDCGMGLIGVCQVPSDKKLIFYSRNGHPAENGYQSNGDSLLFKCDEDIYEVTDDIKDSYIVGTGKANIVKLPSGQQIKNKIVNAKTEHVDYNNTKPIDQLPKKRRSASKTIQRPFHICLHCKGAGTVDHVQHPNPENSLNKRGSKKKTQGYSSSQVSLGNARDDDYVQGSIRGRSYDSPSIRNEVREAYVSQKLNDAKYLVRGGSGHQSKQFLNALEILNWNKELFFKLLHDLKSLIVENIQELRDCQGKIQHAKSSSKDEASDAKECGRLIGTEKFHKHSMHYFLEKIMFRKRNPLLSNGSNEHQHSEIVILKAGPTSLQKCGNENGSGGVRSKTFSYSGIKKKFGYAKPAGFFNRTEKVATSKNSRSSIRREDSPTSGMGNRNSSFRHHKQRESSIYYGVRNPLYEKVTGFEGKGLLGEKVPKSPERKFSLPEFDLLYLKNPPRRDSNRTFVTSEMRFCAYGNYTNCRENNRRLQKERENSFPSPMREIVEARAQAYEEKSSGHVNIYLSKQNISEIHFPGTEVLIDSWSSKGSPSSDTSYTENNNCSELYSESNSIYESTTSLGTERVTGGDSLSLGPDSAQELDSCCTKDEQVSPSTFLHQFIIEDVTSPSNAEPRLAAGPPVQSLQFTFKEQSHKTNSSTCVYDNGSISNYAQTLLQVCSLNWDELSARGHASPKLLSPSIFEEMISLSQSRVYCRLVFDLINEIILEVYHSLKCTSWLSCINPNAPAISSEKSMFKGVVKCVDWHLFQQAPPPQTIGHLLERDLARSRKRWMDIRTDDEDIAFEIVEDFLEELITEITIQLQIETLQTDDAFVSNTFDIS